MEPLPDGALLAMMGWVTTQVDNLGGYIEIDVLGPKVGRARLKRKSARERGQACRACYVVGVLCNALAPLLIGVPSAEARRCVVAPPRAQSAVAAVPPRATGFVHRGALYSIQYGIEWRNRKDTDTALSLVDALQAKLNPYFSPNRVSGRWRGG